MSRLRAVALDHRGFTMTELLVAVAVVGIVIGGMATFMTTGQSHLQMGAGQVEAQQNARIAFELMIREIRAAGVDPTSANFPAVVNIGGVGLPTATGFRLQSDLDGNCNGLPVAACLNGPNETIEYTIVGNNLRRQVLNVDPQPQVIIAGLEAAAGPAFQFQNGTGGAPATELDIRTVVVTLQTVPPTIAAAAQAEHGKVRIRMTDTVRLRNRT